MEGAEVVLEVMPDPNVALNSAIELMINQFKLLKITDVIPEAEEEEEPVVESEVHG